MDTQIKNEARVGPASFQLPLQLNTRNNSITKPTKWRRVLSALTHGKRFTRFQAERELSDHTLPSTVSALQAKGVTILRRDVVVPGYRNIETRCCEYWLAPESRVRALELLGHAGHQATVSEASVIHPTEARHGTAPFET